MIEVKILSGPRFCHARVRAAVQRYEFAGGDAEVVATQDFSVQVD